MKIIVKNTIQIFLLALFLLQCSDEPKENQIQLNKVEQIKQRGKLIAITGYNAYSYFLYRGQTMGFEYELLENLVNELGVKLEIKIIKDVSKMFEMVQNGEGDLLAFNLTVTKQRTNEISFTNKVNTITQVLVQKKPENWRKMTLDNIDDSIIRSTFDLENKTVYVRNNSAYKTRLMNLSEEIGGDINIVEADSVKNTEDLIAEVANGEIQFTISDDNVARLNQAYYPNLDIKTEIGLPQKIAWAVDKDSDSLLIFVNNWLSKLQKKADFYVIYDRYYKNRNAYKVRRKSDYLTASSGNISEYDDIIKMFADSLGWDWRIFASQIYQESQFDPKATSWAGAKGLMQIMPITAKQHKLKNVYDPYENLNAGFSHILWLDEYWKEEIVDREMRLNFILASYNIGQGHIQDARRLATKYGANPDIWENNVAKFLLKKSKKEYYQDEVVNFGYCRGVEPIKYVNEIFERYEQYKQFVN